MPFHIWIILNKERRTFKNSLPARAIACRNASFSFSGDWSGSIQSKFNLPTLEDKCVLFTYLGGWSVSYWLIPLSTASIACYKYKQLITWVCFNINEDKIGITKQMSIWFSSTLKKAKTWVFLRKKKTLANLASLYRFLISLRRQ